MDITRHWRLKTTRTTLLATRCPATGAVILPQSGAASLNDERYDFAIEQSRAQAEDVTFARAAR
jgi:hypothetical protein